MDDLISRKALLDAMPKNDMLMSIDVRRVICDMPAVGSGWISIEDKLPEEYKGENDELINYLCYMPEYGVDIANYLKPAGVWVCMGIPTKVTHWMALPEPPKGGTV